MSFLSSPPMAKDLDIKLWCLVEGDTKLFEIQVDACMSVSFLKKVIWKARKRGYLRGVDATGLVLWKVSSV